MNIGSVSQVGSTPQTPKTTSGADENEREPTPAEESAQGKLVYLKTVFFNYKNNLL